MRDSVGKATYTMKLARIDLSQLIATMESDETSTGGRATSAMTLDYLFVLVLDLLRLN